MVRWVTRGLRYLQAVVDQEKVLRRSEEELTVMRQHNDYLESVVAELQRQVARGSLQRDECYRRVRDLEARLESALA